MEAKTLPADVCVFGHFRQLSPAAVHSADCWFDSGVKWWIHVSSIVTYLWKNSFLLHWNSCKQCSESLTHCCEQTLHPLWTQLSHWKMFMQNGEYTAIYSFISCNFNLWSAKTSLWSFLVFSRTTAEFGQPKCSVSFASVQPCSKLMLKLTIVSGAEFK